MNISVLHKIGLLSAYNILFTALCVCVISGGQEMQPISSSDVIRYQRHQEQVYTAQPELVNSEYFAVFTM